MLKLAGNLTLPYARFPAGRALMGAWCIFRAGDDVRTMSVHGKVLMRDRKVLTLNGGAVIKEGQSLVEAVRAAIR